MCYTGNHIVICETPLFFNLSALITGGKADSSTLHAPMSDGKTVAIQSSHDGEVAAFVNHGAT